MNLLANEPSGGIESFTLDQSSREVNHQRRLRPTTAYPGTWSSLVPSISLDELFEDTVASKASAGSTRTTAGFQPRRIQQSSNVSRVESSREVSRSAANIEHAHVLRIHQEARAIRRIVFVFVDAFVTFLKFFFSLKNANVAFS